jgi:hypothetical protein
MTTIVVYYMTILYMVMGLFALVGFFRGWLKEGVTTFFLGLLTIILTNPELAKTIFGYINGIIKLFWTFLEAGGSLDMGVLSATAATVEPPIYLDPENHRLYVGVLILLVALSYVTGKFTITAPISPLSRLLGGILGLFNGFLAMSLAREYLMGLFLEPEPITAQAIPEQVSIQITGMPRQSLLIGYFPMILVAVALAMFALVLASILKFQLPIAKK